MAPEARNLPMGANTPLAVQNATGYGRSIEFLPAFKEIYTDAKGIFVKNPIQVFTRGTGGAQFSFIKQRGLEDAIAKIGSEIHSQYLISYAPKKETLLEGGFHEIQVAVDYPRAKAQTRPGYWLAGDELTADLRGYSHSFHAEPSGRRAASHRSMSEKPAHSVNFRDLWPDVWALIRPRRKILAIGVVLMAINRVSGLVLPYSTKTLIDNVIGKKQFQLLEPLIAAVVIATIVQGASSFTLAQLLSKSAQRLIAELRQKVQAHVGRLPISYYDSNKTGTLVSRIMSDVEGVRNLVGTGLIEFAGGLMTAVISLFVLLRISALMTGIALTVVLVFAFVLSKAFKTIRPIFRERGKITAEVTGRLTESLGGVRVVKGYHGEAREAAVFTKGVERLLNNVLRSLTAMSVMTLSATVLMGIVGALVMYIGTREIAAGTLTLGGLMTFTAFLAFLITPVIGVVQIGTQISEAFAGLERTREVLSERPEDQDPSRTIKLPEIRGRRGIR